MPSRRISKRKMKGGSAPYPDYFGTAGPSSCSSVQPVINVPSCNEGLNPAPYAYGCGVGLGSSINYGSQDAFASRYFVGATASGGSRRSSKRRSSKRRSLKKRNTKRGGAYYLGVEAPKVGGLAQIVPVYDPLKPAFSPRMLYDYPSPAYLTEPKLIETGLKGGKRRSNLRRRQRGGVDPAFLLPQEGKGPIPNDADLKGNFNPDMMTRSFNCHQPYWGPSCT